VRWRRAARDSSAPQVRGPRLAGEHQFDDGPARGEPREEVGAAHCPRDTLQGIPRRKLAFVVPIGIFTILDAWLLFSTRRVGRLAGYPRVRRLVTRLFQLAQSTKWFTRVASSSIGGRLVFNSAVSRRMVIRGWPGFWPVRRCSAASKIRSAITAVFRRCARCSTPSTSNRLPTPRSTRQAYDYMAWVWTRVTMRRNREAYDGSAWFRAASPAWPRSRPPSTFLGMNLAYP